MTGLPRFEEVTRLRPVDMVAPGAVGFEQDGAGEGALPQPAPYVAVTAETPGPAELTMLSVSGEITATLDDQRRTALRIDGEIVRSRRHGRSRWPVDALALTVTGAQATVFTRSGAEWTARAKLDLTDHVDTFDPEWCAGLRVRARGAVGRIRAGGFGQLGLRDLRLVSNADGSPYSPDGRLLLTATSAGPGFFGTGHASVWELDPAGLSLTHRSDVFFRRGGRVYGDHAIHLLRVGDDWLVATSTWGDFVDPAVDHVHVELGRTSADLLSGRHVVETDPLHLPTTGLRSVGVWDPHLVSTSSTDVDDSTNAGGSSGGGTEWLVGYVSARRYFDFYPVLASGPTLDDLTVRGAATDRRSTEGTTLVWVSTGSTGGGGSTGGRGRTSGGEWLVLASDGRGNRRAHRAAYPVFDLRLHQIGTLQAPYPTNLPWPTLVPVTTGSTTEGGNESRLLLIGFDGTPAGGRLAGYGTHGAVVIAREV